MSSESAALKRRTLSHASGLKVNAAMSGSASAASTWLHRASRRAFASPACRCAVAMLLRALFTRSVAAHSRTRASAVPTLYTTRPPQL